MIIRQFTQLVTSSASYQRQMMEMVFSTAFPRDFYLRIAFIAFIRALLREFAVCKELVEGGPWYKQPRSCLDKAVIASSLLISSYSIRLSQKGLDVESFVSDKRMKPYLCLRYSRAQGETLAFRKRQ